MKDVLLDTQAWAWLLLDEDKLSDQVVNVVDLAEDVLVSPISIYEIGQKVHIGKWPEMAPHLRQLPDFIRQQGARIASLTPDVCLLAATIDWPHRDPFDRMIAATAIHYELPLVSTDGQFDDLSEREDWTTRIW